MGHLNSHLIWHKHAEFYFNSDKEILEIGPLVIPLIMRRS